MIPISVFSRTFRWCVAAVICAASAVPLIAQTASHPQAQTETKQQAQKKFAQLPLSFEPNQGQTDRSVQFLAHSAAATIYLAGTDAVISRFPTELEKHGPTMDQSQSVVRMHLLGATEQPVAMTEGVLPGKVNYLSGNDRSRWYTNIPTYSGIRLQSVYPGIDLRYYGQGGTLEYDFIVAPQQSADKVRMTFEGATPHVEKNGDLVLTAQSGEPFRFDKPAAYQTIDGKRMEVPAQFQLAKNGEVNFELGAYDHSRELVIDPTLVYLGAVGTGIQQITLNQMTVDSKGEIFLIGTTNDATFPVTSNAYQKVCGPTKGNSGQVTYYGGYCPSGGGGENAAFVTKLSADGTTLVYSTYLSGQSGTEQGSAIAVDAAGVAYLLGTTGSNDFPITSDAFQKNCLAYYGVFGGPNIVSCDGNYNGGGTEYTIGNQDAFFSKLSADGSSLLYSSFLGGTGPVYPNFIGLDGAGNIYLSGQVNVFSAADIAGCGAQCGPNSQGQVQFNGVTSSGYMTASAAIDQYNNPTRINTVAFLSKFSNDGHTLLYGTFFGDNQTAVDVVPTTAAMGTNGIAFLGGYTQATNFPVTTGALKSACVQPQTGYGGRYCGTYDGYVAAIDTTKSGAASLVYSTRLGGKAQTQGSNTPDEEVLGLFADSSNNVFVTGYTFESTFTMAQTGYQTACPNNTGNIDPSATGYIDRCDSAYLLKLDPTGTKILAGTFFAAPYLRSAETIGNGVRVDSRGNVLLYGKGSNYGLQFPFLNPLQTDTQPSNLLMVAAFSSDLKHLLFSTLFGDPAHLDHNQNVAGGMALDANDNVYFTGDTTDTDFATTAGTYVTAQATGAGHHPFFAKITKILQPTQTTLTAPATAATGRTMTLKAVVVGLYQSTPAATGTVTFTATSTTTSKAITLGTGSLDSTGTATASVTVPVVDSYTVVASYGADNTYDTSVSSSSALTVITPLAAKVSLTASASSVNSGSAVTFTATVSNSAGSSPVPSGSVTFLDGSTTLGTGTITNGTATYSTSSLSVGTHSITAQYGGDSNFASATSTAVSETVNAATISLSASPSSLTITAGQSGTVTITATPVGAYSGTVSFSCGTAITHTSCAFSPTTLTFNNGTTAQSTTLTLNTNVAALHVPQLPGQHRNPAEPLEAGLIAGFSLLALTGRRSAQRKLRGMFLLAAFSIATLTIGMTGCGGGSAANSTPKGSYTLPVTASVSGSTVTLNLTVNVQ